MHVPLVRVPIFAEEERSKGKERETGMEQDLQTYAVQQGK